MYYCYDDCHNNKGMLCCGSCGLKDTCHEVCDSESLEKPEECFNVDKERTDEE